MANADRPAINLDGLTPRVDEPASINKQLRTVSPGSFGDELNFSNIDLNKYSKYFKPYGGVGLKRDINEFRAQTQKGSEKWLNGLVKFGGKVGTSFLEPFVDVGYGAGKAVMDGKFSSLFDNEITQGFDKFNDYLAERFPNYYTQGETAAATLSPHNWFTANFWSDKVLGGAAFTVGTLLNAYATMGIMSGLKGTQLGLRAGHNGAKASMATNKALGKLGKETIDDVIKAGSAYKFKNGSEALSASLFSVMGEAGLEARELGKVLRSELEPMVQDGRLSKNEADKRIEDAMGIAFASNVAIVGTSQFLQFGKLFQRGYRPNKVRLNAITKEGGKFAQELPTTGFGKFVAKTTGARIAVRDMATEAKEEGLQFLTQKSLEYKYGEELMKDNVTALNHGMKELFTTKEGQENMLIGAILGTGSHFGKLIGSSRSEPYNKVRETATGKVVNALNEHFGKDDALLYKLINNAGMQVAATDRKEYYLSKDDIFNYKNEEAAEFAAIVKSFADLGALDILDEQIDAFGSMPNEEFNTIFDKHKDVGVRKSKVEYINEVKDKVKKYSRIYQSVEDTYADRLPSYRSGLYMSAVMVEDLADREIKTKNKIQDRTNIDYKDFSALRSRQYYERAKEKIKDQGKTDPNAKDKPEEKIPTDNKEIFDDAYADAINEWAKDHSDEISDKEREEMRREVADLANMLHLRQQYVDNTAYMQSEEGQKDTNTQEFVNKVNDQNSQYIKDITADIAKFTQDKKDGNLDLQALDKRISDAQTMYNASGNKKFIKLRDQLIKLMPETEETEDSSDVSTSTGDQAKDKKKAKEPRDEQPRPKTKEQQTESQETNDEVAKTNLNEAQEVTLKNAIKATFKVIEEDEHTDTEDSFNSAKRIPVEEESVDDSADSLAVDAFQALFLKDSPTSLHHALPAKLLYNFEYVAKLIDKYAKEAGTPLTESAFTFVKGQYMAFVHARNPNANIYAPYLDFTFEELDNAVFKADNKYWVTTSEANSTSSQSEEFSREGSRQNRPEDSHSTMHASNATLNRKAKYNTETKQYKEVSNELINTNNLDYNSVNVGAEVILRVPKKLNYTEDGKEGSGSVALKKHLKGKKLTDEELRNLPIELVVDGKQIGMLHIESFIKKHLKGSRNRKDREAQLAKLLELRTFIAKKGEYKSSITRRTNGWLIEFIQDGKKKQTTATTALADPNLKFAIGKRENDTGELNVTQDLTAETEGEIAINKDKVIAGITYALLPVNKNPNGELVYIPAPMQSMRPIDYAPLKGENIDTSETTTELEQFANEAVDSVHDAIEIFLNKADLTKKQKLIVKKMKSNGYDITSVKGLKSYVKNFFYTFDSIRDLNDDKVGGPLREFIHNAEAGNHVLNISPFYIGFGKTGESTIQLARLYGSKGNSTHVLAVGDNKLSNKNKIDQGDFLKNLKANLKQQYFRTSLDNLNDTAKFSVPMIKDGGVEIDSYNQYNDFAKKLLRSDVIGVESDETGMFHYSVQPIIEVDTSFLKSSKKEAKKVASEETKEEQEAIEGTNSQDTSEVEDSALEGLSDEAKAMLRDLNTSEHDNDFDSITRIPALDRLETKYGLRKDGKLKKFPNTQIKQVNAKVKAINAELAKESSEHRAKTVRISAKGRSYLGIQIAIVSKQGNVFDSFKKTNSKHNKGKKKKETTPTFGKNVNGDIYITNLPLFMQNSVIGSISASFVRRIIATQNDITITDSQALTDVVNSKYKILSRVIKEYEGLQGNVTGNLKTKIDTLLPKLKIIKKHYGAIANMAIRDLSASNLIDAQRFVVTFEDGKPKVKQEEPKHSDTERLLTKEDDDNQDGTEDADQNNENTNLWQAEGSIKVDHKKTISQELKLFLTNIRAFNKNGEVETDFFGQDKLVPFDIVYNVLSRILSNQTYSSKDSFEQMVQEIELHIQGIPFLRDVVENLRKEAKNDKSKIPYQFERAMVKHKVNMFYLGFNYRNVKDEDGNKKGRRFFIFPVDSNSVNNAKIISNNWFSQFRIGEYITINEYTGDDTITKGNYKDFKLRANNRAVAVRDAYKKFTKEENPEKKDELRKALTNRIMDAFDVIGVSTQPNLISDLIDGRFNYFKKNIGVNAVFDTKATVGSSGHYMRFVFNVGKRVGQSLSTNNPFNHNFITALAEHDSRYNSIDYSDVHKDQEGKSIYTYSNFKYIAERAIKLLENKYIDKKSKVKLLQHLESVPFIAGSTWLKDLKRGKLNSSNFKIKYADSIVNFGQAGSGKKVKSAPIADIELYKLGLFMNRGFSSGDKKSTTYVYPTLSDGGTIMEVSALAEDIILNDNNTIGTKTLGKMYKALVKPEVDRIRDFQSKGETGMKGYDQGANRFLFLPNLNDPALGLFENGKLKEKFTQEDKDNIYDVINSYAINLIDNKVKEWIDFGIMAHSNAELASVPILYEKKDLVTEKSMDKIHKWEDQKYTLRTATQLNELATKAGYDINDVVYVYETDDNKSLTSQSGKVVKSLYKQSEATEGLSVIPEEDPESTAVKTTYGINVRPDPEETGKDIYTKNEIIAQYKKLAKIAEKNEDKLFVINISATQTPRNNHSKYARYNIAEMLATVKFPKNVAIKDKLTETTLKAADNLRDKTREELETNHEKAKLSVYKGHRLHFVDEQYYKDTFGENGDVAVNKPYYTAASYVINYMMANANIHQLFIGDPALYYKPSKKEDATEIDHIKETFDNISKRLAGDRAPGEFMAGSFNPSETFKTVFLPDRTLSSEAKEFMASLGYDYSGIDGTDAQEFTTLKEDMYVRFKMGMITKALYNALYDPKKGIVTKELAKGNYDYHQNIQSGLEGDLLREFKEVVNQPMKPVYVNNVAQKLNGQKIDRRVYVKTSAFALSPDMTKNKELNKLRVYMEKNGIDRATFATGVKVGDNSATSKLKFFNEDGTITIDEDALNANSIELPRDGFRIQQEIPFKEDKVRVKFGVQESALLFANILNEDIDGVSGKDLKTEYDNTYKKLYENAALEVYEELGIPREDFLTKGLNKDNTVDIDNAKLSKLIRNEAINRGYSKNELDALGITAGEFNLRLAFHSRGLSIETVLNSIITNRVIKQKFYGKGFILGTQEGFKYLEDKKLKDKVIYTKEVIDELKPMGFTNEKGEYVGIEEAGKEGIKFQPAQVFVPSILKDGKGKSINLFEKENGKWKYLIQMEGRLVLNHKKVDPDILKMFGFRIPTQGHNSMAYIEIAGFLPKKAGDLIIAPRDFVKQMGSDFDVDKLYSYMYNLKIGEDGYIGKVDSNENSSEGLKNKILDIHFKILSSTNKKIQQQIFEPLGFGLLKSDPGKFDSNDEEIKKVVNEEYQGNLGDYIHDLNDISDREFTGLSDMYQRDTFLEGRDGTVGIGVFSLNSTTNAAIQGTTMTIGRTTKNKAGDNVYKEHEVWFGEHRSNSAYEPTTHESGKLQFDKSQVISWYQSASVDNAKEKVLFKFNINGDTFGAIAYLNQVGFHEEVLWFINQPIVRDYVRQKQISSSSIAVGDNNIDRANEAINKKYKKALMDKTDSLDEKGKKIKYNDGRQYSINNLHELLKAHKKGEFEGLKDKEIVANKEAVIFYKSQLGILSLFKEYEKRGNHLQTLQNTINSSSKGAGRSLSEAHIKANEIADLSESTVFDGADQLIGEYKSQTEYNLLKKEDKEGFVYVGNALWIKPTTIQGHASVYGTLTSSYLFNSMFPYSSTPVGTAVDLIADIRGHESKSIGNRAKDVNQVWTELKKFANSKALEETAETLPRRRLLLDEFDKDGDRLSTSLASTINEIKSGRLIRDNAFIDGLQVRSTKSPNAFSTVQFNSTENLDDNLIYQGFSDLIENDRPLEVSFDPNYSTKQLADDLIKYALMTGGVQQYSQFIRYVPFDYLTEIGYNEVINSINMEDTAIIGDFKTNDYSVTPEFITQYFQHFPDKAPIVRRDSEFVNIDLDAEFNTVNFFTVEKAELIARRKSSRAAQKFLRKRGENQDYSLVEFVSIMNYDTNQLQLYKLQDPINGRYVRISKLGASGVSEYSYGNQFKDSFMNTTLRNEEAEIITMRNGTVSSPFKDDKLEPTKLGKKYDLYSGSSPKILAQIVKRLESKKKLDSQERINLALAKQMLANSDVFNTPVEVDNSISSEGNYNYNTDIIRINDQYIAKQPDNKTAFERVFLHEYLHATTVGIIIEDSNNPHVSALQGIIEHTKAHIQSQGKVNIDRMLKEIATAKKEKRAPRLRKEEIPYIGLQNPAEFITEFMTNPEFRDKLSEIPYKDKTIYDKIVETIIKLIESFGIEVEANTAADAGYIEILNIIDMSANGKFYENLTAERSPVEAKTIKPADAIRGGFAVMSTEEDTDSIVRDMLDQGRIEFHCKL